VFEILTAFSCKSIRLFEARRKKAKIEQALLTKCCVLEGKVVVANFFLG